MYRNGDLSTIRHDVEAV